MYVQCTDCQSIHREGALERDTVGNDLLTLRGYCPCGCDRFRDVRVCTRCHKAEALPQDDWCGPCALTVDLITVRPVELTAPEFVS